MLVGRALCGSCLLLVSWFNSGSGASAAVWGSCLLIPVFSVCLSRACGVLVLCRFKGQGLAPCRAPKIREQKGVKIHGLRPGVVGLPVRGMAGESKVTMLLEAMRVRATPSVCQKKVLQTRLGKPVRGNEIKLVKMAGSIGDLRDRGEIPGGKTPAGKAAGDSHGTEDGMETRGTEEDVNGKVAIDGNGPGPTKPNPRGLRTGASARAMAREPGPSTSRWWR